MTITKGDFKKRAMPIPITIAGQSFVIQPKNFKTGSLGWTAQEEIDVTVGNETIKCKVNINIVIPGTKK